MPNASNLLLPIRTLIAICCVSLACSAWSAETRGGITTSLDHKKSALSSTVWAYPKTTPGGDARSVAGQDMRKVRFTSVSDSRSPSFAGTPADGFQLLADFGGNYDDGRDGLMIITTEELKRRIENFPEFVYTKSQVRGFRVFMATENEWAGRSQMGREAAARKAFPGRVAGLDILDFLRRNYKRLGVKFVLFVGDARPEEGTTPMLRVRHHKWQKNFVNWSPDGKQQIDRGSLDELGQRLYDASLPSGRYVDWGDVISDYPYADLDTDWHASGDGFLDAGNDKNPKHTRTGGLRRSLSLLRRRQSVRKDLRHGSLAGTQHSLRHRTGHQLSL